MVRIWMLCACAVCLTACTVTSATAPTAVPPTALGLVPTVAVLQAPPQSTNAPSVLTAVAKSPIAVSDLPTRVAEPTLVQITINVLLPPTPTRGRILPPTRVVQRRTPIPSPTFVPIDISTFPQGDSFGDELFFETFVDQPERVRSVQFTVTNRAGTVLYQRADDSTRYCAFGGGDDNSECNVWRFSEHNNQWPDGTPVDRSESYQLTSVTTLKTGEVITQQLNFRVEL